MSYCRLSEDSDVYAYHNINNDYTIHIVGGTIHCKSLEKFKLKLLELKNQGLKVPYRVFERIDSELKARL